MTTAVEIFCPACGHTWDADCYLHEDDVDTLLVRHNALVEAVKMMLESYKNAEECSCPYCMDDFEAARAEVDRLIGGE